MTSIISIVDTNSYSTSSGNYFKVIVSDYNNNTVSLAGMEAVKYLKNTILNGFVSSDFLTKDTDILPPGVKVIGKNYVVFERPPSYQNVFFNTEKVHSEMSEDNVRVYRLPIPWQIYIATFDSNYYLNKVYMYFSPESLSSLDQPLYLATLPNFYTDSNLCRPMFSNMVEVERYSKNISGVISSAYDWVWNNGTNNDLNEAVVNINFQLVIRESSCTGNYSSSNLLSTTVLSKMPEETYNSFAKIQTSNMTYYSASQVRWVFASWEQCTLEEVVSYRWPVPSVSNHFDSSYYSISDTNSITEHPNYYNWLENWLHDNYEDESDNDIQERIENGDYDGSGYHEYVLDNYLKTVVDSMVPPTFKDILSLISSNDDNISTKAAYVDFISKAFTQGQ